MSLLHIFLILTIGSELCLGQRDRVLPGELQELHFVHDENAQRRRPTPYSVPQMELGSFRCITGFGCNDERFVHPSHIRCLNTGGNLTHPVWECKANTLEGVDLHIISIDCEHYDDEEDPYILRNSCVAKYDLTQCGEGTYEFVATERVIYVQRAQCAIDKETKVSSQETASDSQEN